LPSATIGGQVDLYEPVHGSAPDIAGKDWANPIGAILSVSMMLRNTAGLAAEAAYIEQAVDAVLSSGFRTADIRQPNSSVVSTSEMGDLIADAVCDSLHIHHAYHAV
ncbi:MAG: isocitrate/isopropylmalate family dehydrogenase, partial [Terriglobales bacterium]